MKVFSLLILLLNFMQLGFAQHISIPRDTSYTLANALKKARANNSEREIKITAIYSNPTDDIEIEENLIYKTIGNRALPANLFYPKSTKPKNIPGILIIHGGGWRTGNKSLMTPMSERLAKSGYFVMAPEYRMSLEAPYPAAVQDVYDAIKWMDNYAEMHHIDMDKIIVMGCSAGGQLAALVGTTYNKPDDLYAEERPGHIAAIIDVDGVLAFKHPDSKEGTMASQWLGGPYSDVPEIWKEASALTHVDQNTPPTLFLGSINPRFLAGRQNYIQKLEQFGVPAETYFLDQAPHSFWLFNPWFEPTMHHIEAFLKKTIE